ncbi:MULTISPECIES: hypothetical protein [unclassified Endozoicomonas]|uniref:hypothetical protein n=1 Tax=unclassified Endozoicomonas TaxID=2644528 RepID=UPI002147C314|nr:MULTISPECIES: hypothetical protein [unclassified Endozoicomonas]
MANPLGTGSTSPGTDLNVQVTSETPNRHRGSTTMYSLRRCCALKDTLIGITKGMTWPTVPERPAQCSFLEGGERLESRAVEVSSSGQSSSTHSRKVSEASEAEIRAELEKMDGRIQQDYQRFCEQFSLCNKIVSFAMTTELALDDDILFYQDALLDQHKDQPELQVMFNYLNQKTKMLEDKNQEVLERDRKIQELTRQLEHSEQQRVRAQDEQQAKALVDEKVIHLEKLLREADCRATEMQRDLSKIKEEKAEESKEVESLNERLAAYQLYTDNELEYKKKICAEKEKQSKRIESLEKLVGAYQSRLAANHDSKGEAWDEQEKQSRQWDADRAAMEREIETLRTKLRALSMDEQTTETGAALDGGR